MSSSSVICGMSCWSRTSGKTMGFHQVARDRGVGGMSLRKVTDSRAGLTKFFNIAILTTTKHDKLLN